MRYHLTSIRMAIIQNDNNFWLEYDKIRTLIHFGGNVKWYSHFGKQFGSSSKHKTCSYHMTQQFHPRYIPMKNEYICLHKSLDINVHSSITHNSQKVLKKNPMSVNWRMDQQNVILLLLSMHKKIKSWFTQGGNLKTLR